MTISDVLLQINNAPDIICAKNSLSALRNFSLEEQAKAISADQFKPVRCSVDEVKEFYESYFQGFEWRELKSLLETLVSGESCDVPLFISIHSDEMNLALAESIISKGYAEFKDILCISGTYYGASSGNVSLFGILSQNRDTASIIVSKVKSLPDAEKTDFLSTSIHHYSEDRTVFGVIETEIYDIWNSDLPITGVDAYPDFSGGASGGSF